MNYPAANGRGIKIPLYGLNVRPKGRGIEPIEIKILLNGLITDNNLFILYLLFLNRQNVI